MSKLWILIQFNNKELPTLYTAPSPMALAEARTFVKGQGWILGEGECDEKGVPIDTDGIIRNSGYRVKTR